MIEKKKKQKFQYFEDCEWLIQISIVQDNIPFLQE